MLRTAASPLARKRRTILPSGALPRIFHLRFVEVFVPSVGRSTAAEAAAATAARKVAGCRSVAGVGRKVLVGGFSSESGCSERDGNVSFGEFSMAG
jgi:hypothetical protein